MNTAFKPSVAMAKLLKFGYLAAHKGYEYLSRNLVLKFWISQQTLPAKEMSTPKEFLNQ